jgi:branched-chain amino acid transport system permease protein
MLRPSCLAATAGREEGISVQTRRTVRILGALVGATAALTLMTSVAHADGEAVNGTLLTNEREPVAGVTITVTDDSGFSESATTGDDGRWEVPLPASGEYTVTLEEDTLPDGTATPVKNPVVTEVASGVVKPVLFVLGARAFQTTSTWERVAQLTVDGLRLGLLLALAAVGLSMIFGTTGLTNFAHGELIAFGALMAYTFHVQIGMPLIVGGALAVVATALFGALQDRGLWYPLRKRGTGLIAMMIVSIGLALVLRNLFLIIYGGGPLPYNDFQAQAGLEIGPVKVTPANLVIMGLAVVVLAGSAWILLKTRLGKATRAVADNPALAATAGIDVERVILFVWTTGAALAGLSGVLIGVGQQPQWNLGVIYLLLIFAAVTLGGLGTALGAVVGSLIIGLLLQLSTLVIPSELQAVGALGLLIVVLLVKPEGLLGRRGRVG